jgi:hypothetical protein
LNNLLEPDILDFLLAYGMMFSCCMIWEKYIGKRLTYQRGILFSLLVGYLLITLLLAVRPVPDAIGLYGPKMAANLQPLRTIVYRLASGVGLGSIFAGLLWPVPFVFFIGFLTCGRLPFIGLFGVGCICALLLQVGLVLLSAVPGFPVHVFDIDELLLNAAGVSAGSTAFALMKDKEWMKHYLSELMP